MAEKKQVYVAKAPAYVGMEKCAGMQCAYDAVSGARVSPPCKNKQAVKAWAAANGYQVVKEA